LLFAYSSVIGNYYYGEANIRFITKNKKVLNVYRVIVGGMVLWGSLMSLQLAWNIADLMMALLTMCNLVAIVMLSKQAIWLLNDYRDQKRRGIKSPVFTKDKMPEIKDKLVAW
jgi:AGCS family alanine or glycine:cation symporter